jgi:hypothetical protein
MYGNRYSRLKENPHRAQFSKHFLEEKKECTSPGTADNDKYSKD